MLDAKDIASLAFSSAALTISVLSGWASLLRRGKLYMAQPSSIYFGSDGPQREGGGAPPQVYLRSTLFSTGKRGHIVESLYVRIRNGLKDQVFNIWVFGERELARGSGMFVGEQGATANHHFLTASGASRWLWAEGEYELTIYAVLIPGKRAVTLHKSTLAVDSSGALALSQGDCGLFFDWHPELALYQSHVRPALPPSPQAAA